MHVSQPIIPPAVAVGEALVVEAHQVQDGGVEVVDVDRVACHADAVFVGFAVGDAGSDAGASEQYRIRQTVDGLGGDGSALPRPVMT